MFESIILVQKLVVKLFAFVYLSAFASFYVQIPALYGKDGLMPLGLHLNEISKRFGDRKMEIPTIFWFSKQINSYVVRIFPDLESFDYHENTLHLVTLLGIALALGVLLERNSNYFNNFFVMFLLWIFYLSLLTVGQVFMSFQWDIMLIESGFLVMFLIPYRTKAGTFVEDDIAVVSRELLRWLAFRLFFSSGVLKLLSGCPTWWNLTALDWHFESQCIPHQLSWYAHQIPAEMKKFMTAGNFIVLIFMAILFYFPYRPIRIYATLMQILMQLSIIFSGNYNFFNILSIGLTLVVFDDDFLQKYTPRVLGYFLGVSLKGTEIKKQEWSWLKFIFDLLLCAAITGALFYFLFPMNSWLTGKLPFDMKFIKDLTKTVCVYMTYFAIATVLLQLILFAIKNRDYKSSLLLRYLKRIFAIIFFTFVFTASIYPFYMGLEVELKETYINNNLIKATYQYLGQYHCVNQYGLFRRMTGVGGRPELIIEDKGTWKPYEFLYKPGNLSGPLVVAIPHQPRLDWQMWFAALGNNINQEPWLINLLTKLFSNSESALTLFKENPFPEKPPNWLRINSYKYSFTNVKERNETGKIWKRSFSHKYLPEIRFSDSGLSNYISQSKIPEIRGEKYKVHPWQALPLLEMLIGVLVINFVNNLIQELREEKMAERERKKAKESAPSAAEKDSTPS